MSQGSLDTLVAAATEHLVGYIREETRIQLHEEDVALRVAGSSLSAVLLGEPAGEWTLEEGADAEDLAMAVMEGVGDIRDFLVRRRLGQARAGLEALRTAVQGYLAEDGWPADDLQALSFDIVEDGSPGAAGGWPDAEVVVTVPQGGEVRIRAQLYEPAEPADPGDLADAINEALSSGF